MPAHRPQRPRSRRTDPEVEGVRAVAAVSVLVFRCWRYSAEGPGRADLGLVRAAAVPGRWPGAAPTAASPRLGALTLAAEVGGGRRMASANAFLGFLRADPSEYSSGSRVHRGRLTKAGNAHLWAQLVESA